MELVERDERGTARPDLKTAIANAVEHLRRSSHSAGAGENDLGAPIVRASLLALFVFFFVVTARDQQ
ncbi:MAG: hypothetical protein ABJE66_05960 [Deltaproteobacteria bacterium]